MPTTLLDRLFAAILCLFLLVSSAHAQAVADTPLDALAGLEQQYVQAETEYLDALSAYLPDAYRVRFSALSDKGMQQIAEARRLWVFWTLGGSDQFDFQKQFLDPIDQVGEMLIIKAESITDKTVKSARVKAGRLAEQLDKARKQAGVEIDPTVGVLSPTGIAFPRLDQPHTTVDRLLLMEQSIVLAQTVGPRESKPVLMINAKNCIQIDVEEASFTMYANKVRMLTGANAWVANPVTTACARDHSIDRKEGRASGHSSTVPGKEGLGARASRFGTPVRSEGAGGGQSGWHYIRGLSYGGGHTGPLYRSMRNAVGPGRVEGVYTSMYYYDDAFKHACQEYRNELFLPPGVTKSDLQLPLLITAYDALQQQQYAKAYATLKVQEMTEDKFQLAIQRYLLARINAEVDWWLTGIEEFATAGDVYGAHARLQEATPLLSGIPAFDKAAEKIQTWLSKPGIAKEITVGEQYRKACAQSFTTQTLQKLIEEHPDSIYAKAARKCIDENLTNEPTTYAPLMFFRDQSPHINKWAYLVDVVGK